MPRAARLALTLTAVYVGSALVLPGAWRSLEQLAAYQLPVVLGGLGVVPLALGVIACRVRVGGPFTRGWREGLRLARAEGWFTERLAWSLALLALLPVFFWAFAVWKVQVGPFTWDARLAAWDLAIHGTRPHHLIPLTPAVVGAMDRWYWSWIYVLLGVILWQSWYGTSDERARFWLAFVLTWVVLGTVLAWLMASAGPAFYWRVTGDLEPYHHLRTTLAAADQLYSLRLLDTRHELWDALHRGMIMFGGGISAFPSIHVAMPALASCAAWRVSRWLAVAFLLYALATLVCTVGLGWHYAVDGYASLLLVPMIWWGAGRLSR